MTTDLRLIDLERLTPDEQARLHLMAIWPDPLPYEAYELRCLDCRQKPTTQGPRRFIQSIDDIVDAAMQYRDRWDVFVGVATRACPGAVSLARCAHEEKGADHVSRVHVAWGDFDTKNVGLEELTGTLTGLAVSPTVLVGSGKGIHAYWRLLEPTSELRRVEQVNRGLRLRFGADNAVDAARILRVAGTFNHKYGEPLPVSLLRCPDVHP